MTTCTDCDDYLEKRRTALLPLIGAEVVRTGTNPQKVTSRLLTKYHHLGHPTPTTPPPPPTQATKALRRLASQKRRNP